MNWRKKTTIFKVRSINYKQRSRNLRACLTHTVAIKTAITYRVSKANRMRETRQKTTRRCKFNAGELCSHALHMESINES